MVDSRLHHNVGSARKENLIMQTLQRPEKNHWSMARRATKARPGRAPQPRIADSLAIAAGIGLGASIGLAFLGESIQSLHAPSALMTLVGRVSGLSGSYLMLIMVLLISRMPWLERTVGQDRLVGWHRRIGGWPIALIALHIVTITWGYAQVTSVSVIQQFWTFLLHYPNILASFVAFGIFTFAGLASAKRARSQLKYETWWAIHLYMYVALALAFAHQIKTGVMFITYPAARYYWIGIWVIGASVVLGFRLMLPIFRNVRHRLRVESVYEETPGVYSVILSGRKLSLLEVSGGQFFMWRFMTKGLWWHSHPYSLSALPRPPFMRVTVKSIGDQSGAVAHLRPGTRVFVEGPYGKFTRHARTSERVILIGAGVGLTPLRALLEDLPKSVDVTVLVRASSHEDIVHRQEIIELVRQRQATLFELVGSRHNVRIDAAELRKLLGTLSNADVYICGPQDFNELITKSVTKLGARERRIHNEIFSF
jgi:predicted ferric reductase